MPAVERRQLRLAEALHDGEDGRVDEPDVRVGAHLRSVILGRSQTVPIVDGSMTLGEFGRIYFADLDQVRARERTVLVQIVGE